MTKAISNAPLGVTMSPRQRPTILLAPS